MPRLLIAVCVLLTAGCLRAASTDAGDGARAAVAGAPSRLDYLVLASMADAPRPLSMAAYRPESIPQ